MDVISVKCPQCGASGQPRPGADVFVCGFCGSYNTWDRTQRQYSLSAHTRDEARIKLGQLGLSFDEATFLSVIRDDDDDAISLFLTAGATKWGVPALLTVLDTGNTCLMQSLLARDIRLDSATALKQGLTPTYQPTLIEAHAPYSAEDATEVLLELVRANNAEAVARLFEVAKPDPNPLMPSLYRDKDYFLEGRHSLLIRVLACEKTGVAKVLMASGAGLLGPQAGEDESYATAEAKCLLRVTVRLDDPELLGNVMGFGFDHEGWKSYALGYAASIDAMENVRLLRTLGAELNRDALRIAADAVCRNNVSTVQCFLEAGLDPNAVVVVKKASSISGMRVTRRRRVVSLLRIADLRSARAAREALRKAGAQHRIVDVIDALSVKVGCFLILLVPVLYIYWGATGEGRPLLLLLVAILILFAGKSLFWLSQSGQAISLWEPGDNN